MSGTRQTIRWYKDSGWFETESFGEQTYIEKYSKKHKKAKKEEANA
jgi:hypothetical protein